MKKSFYFILSGVLLAASWPTYGFPLLIFFAFVPMLIGIEHLLVSGLKRKALRVFGLSYLTFFIWNFITTYWLLYASEIGGWFAILVNSLLMALIMLVYFIVRKRNTQSAGLLFLATLWIAFEKFHLNWDFSWPWLNLGNVFATYPEWIQWYEYTGSFGGSLWIWLVTALMVKSLSKGFQPSPKANLKKVLLPFAVLSLPIAYSYAVYVNYKEEKNPVNVIALQPNIDPYAEKYFVTNKTVFEKLYGLSKDKIDQHTDFWIAPETVFAKGTRMRTLESAPEMQGIDSLSGKYPKLQILTGISLFETFPNQTLAGNQANYIQRMNGDTIWYKDYNSALFKQHGALPKLYHKSKLVVGVETVPYPKVFKFFLGNFMIDLGGTLSVKSTQENREVFHSHDDSHRVAPIICYESVYGEYVTGYVQNGADFLAIITNDAWWNDSEGHKQHLNYARIRAIETRRSIARSANTGISAIINQRGDIEKSLAYNTAGALKGTLNANNKLTFYVIHGDYIARIALFMAGFIFLISLFRKRKIIE
ncbi:MAG: apolipoprotein N-acyltransferase [Flavobacteriaceae bacterium]|nr:apolipoprotein N-acyltransferase [Flavobacteriaceae bacterium]